MQAPRATIKKPSLLIALPVALIGVAAAAAVMLLKRKKR
jgi:hypothetical protein